MEKKVIHFKLKTMKSHEDGFIDMNTVSNFMKLAKNILGNEYHVVLSPFDPSMSDGDGVFYNFDMEQLSREDLDEIMGLQLGERD